jgi:hypothetical protein
MSTLMKRLVERNLLDDVARIAAKHNATVEEVTSRMRQAHIQAARKECYELLIERGWSAAEIARLFERDHTTILGALGRTRAANRAPPAHPVLGKENCPTCGTPISWAAPLSDREAARTFAFGRCECGGYWRLQAWQYPNIAEVPVEVAALRGADGIVRFSDGQGGPQRTAEELLEAIAQIAAQRARASGQEK